MILCIPPPPPLDTRIGSWRSRRAGRTFHGAAFPTVSRSLGWVGVEKRQERTRGSGSSPAPETAVSPLALVLAWCLCSFCLQFFVTPRSSSRIAFRFPFLFALQAVCIWFWFAPGLSIPSRTPSGPFASFLRRIAKNRPRYPCTHQIELIARPPFDHTNQSLALLVPKAVAAGPFARACFSFLVFFNPPLSLF